MTHLPTINGRVVQSGRQLILDATLPLTALFVPHTGTNTDSGNDGMARGIVGPTTVYVNATEGYSRLLATYAVRGVVGLPVVQPLGGPAASLGLVYMSGLQLATASLGGQTASAASYSYVLTVIDDAGPMTLAITLVPVASGTESLSLDTPIVFDTQTPNTYGDDTNYIPMGSFVSVNSVAQPSIVDSANLFGVDPDHNPSVLPNVVLASNYGPHSISLKGTSSFPVTAWVLAEQRPAISCIMQPIYSTAQVGDLVGTVTAFADTGVASLTIVNDHANLLSLGVTGGLLIKSASLVPGTGYVFTIRAVSATGKITDRVVLFTVLAGTLLDPSAMTATVSPLSNYSPTSSTARRTAVQATVAGMAGPITWRFKQPFSNPQFLRLDSNNRENFELLDPTQGVITTMVQALRADTYQLEVIATNGPVTCVKTVPVVVTPFVGPIIFVGKGMTDTSSAAYNAAVAAYGTPGFTFENWLSRYYATNTYGICPPAYAGSTTYVFANSDINYYADQCGDGTDGGDRFGMAGPATIIGVPYQGTMPRFGGIYGSGSFGGVDDGQKGFLVLNNGDFTVRGIWFSNIHANGYQGDGSPESNSTGCGIRWNGDVYGSLTVDQCYFSDCDQGIETGVTNGTVTITNTEVVNCGGVYVSSGATHNLYIGVCSQLIMDNVLSWRCMNGHTLKNRALTSTITRSRLFDSERGGASNIIDYANGGVHTFDGGVLHKGTFAQNPNLIGLNDDLQNGDTNPPYTSLVVSNTTFIVNTDIALFSAAMYMQGVISGVNGQYSTMASVNNSFYGVAAVNRIVTAPYINYNGSVANDPTPPIVSETGVTILTQQPALDFTHPFPNTGSIPARPGPFYFPYDGENRNNYVASNGTQIDPGSDDIRVSVSGVKAGDTIFTAVAQGAPYYQSAPNQPDIRINPFVAGSVWSLITNAATYIGYAFAVAPPGRFAIVPSSDGTSCAVTAPNGLPASLAGTFDKVCLHCVAPGGLVVQEQFYVAYVP